MSGYTEDHLVEQTAVQLMQHELGWDVVNSYDEWSGGKSDLGRDGKREVVLVSRLRPALRRLNPDLPVEAIEGAVEELCRDRTALSLAESNREIEKMLDSGLPEKYTTELFETKCGVLFQHVLEKYPESGESVYEAAG